MVQASPHAVAVVRATHSGSKRSFAHLLAPNPPTELPRRHRVLPYVAAVPRWLAKLPDRPVHGQLHLALRVRCGGGAVGRRVQALKECSIDASIQATLHRALEGAPRRALEAEKAAARQRMMRSFLRLHGPSDPPPLGGRRASTGAVEESKLRGRRRGGNELVALRWGSSSRPTGTGNETDCRGQAGRRSPAPLRSTCCGGGSGRRVQRQCEERRGGLVRRFVVVGVLPAPVGEVQVFISGVLVRVVELLLDCYLRVNQSFLVRRRPLLRTGIRHVGFGCPSAEPRNIRRRLRLCRRGEV